MAERTLSSLYVPDALMRARRGAKMHLVPRAPRYFTWCGVLASSMAIVHSYESRRPDPVLAAIQEEPDPRDTFKRAEILDVCCPECKTAVLAAFLRLSDQ